MDGAPRYLGTKIGPALVAQGRKQRWLAGQLGVSESYVSKVLSEQRTIDRPTAERVALLLGVPFFMLFDLHQRSESESVAEAVA